MKKTRRKPKKKLDPFRKGVRITRNKAGDVYYTKYNNNRQIVIAVSVRYYKSVRQYLVVARSRMGKILYEQFFNKGEDALKSARKLVKWH